MANLRFSYPVALDAAGVKTVAQFKAPAQQRVLLKAIEFMPLGSTGASTPCQFDVSLQDGDGTSSDDSSNLQKTPPLAAETIQTTVRKSFTAEPTTSTPIHEITLHQQGARTWYPPDGPITIVGGQRVGLRFLGTQVSCKYRFHLEE